MRQKKGCVGHPVTGHRRHGRGSTQFWGRGFEGSRAVIQCSVPSGTRSASWDGIRLESAPCVLSSSFLPSLVPHKRLNENKNQARETRTIDAAGLLQNSQMLYILSVESVCQSGDVFSVFPHFTAACPWDPVRTRPDPPTQADRRLPAASLHASGRRTNPPFPKGSELVWATAFVPKTHTHTNTSWL